MNRPEYDWRDVSVQRQRVMRDLGALPWAPREAPPFITLRGSFIILAFVTALLGLFTIGAK